MSPPPLRISQSLKNSQIFLKDQNLAPFALFFAYVDFTLQALTAIQRSLPDLSSFFASRA